MDEHVSASFAWRADGGIARVDVDSDLRAAYEEVRAGTGVVLIRGLSTEGTLEEFCAAVWDAGRQFGAALSQNAKGELIGHVFNETAATATSPLSLRNALLSCPNPLPSILALALRVLRQ